MNEHKPIAFFDFDGTLINSDSFIQFARFATGKYRLCKSILLAIPSLILWKSGLKSGGWAKEHLFSYLFAGMSSEEWFLKCQEFSDRINASTNKEMLHCLKHHQKQGHLTVIVTASITDWVIPWAEKMGIDLVIGTEIEFDHNKNITGRFKTPNCYGKEKIVRVHAAFPEVDKVETWAYGDSESDKFLCSTVTHGRII